MYSPLSAIILARGGSKEIPRKNIIDFCGLPLVAHTIRQALSSKYVDKAYVSSDSEEILHIAGRFGALPIERPSELSTDDAASEVAIKHFVENIEANDTILFLQPTSPLREVKDIDRAIEKYYEDGCDSLFSATNGKDLCVWNISGETHNSLSYDYTKRQRRQDIQNVVVENGSFYILDRDGFLQNNNRLFGKIGHYMMDDYKIHEIDNHHDLELCEFLFNTRIGD